MKAVFLDRDGVLNSVFAEGSAFRPPRTVAELEILPGVRQACADLKSAGWMLVGVTNQPDIARGLLDRAVVDDLNLRLIDALALDDIVVCPHDDSDNCACRKPKPGMIVDSASKWHVDLASSVMVGDRWVDIEAGRAAGCKTIYIDNEVHADKEVDSDVTFLNLTSAVPWILQH